jgi:hypothetical protein
MSSKNSDLITYYVNKLILQYAGKAKATATIQALVEKIVIYDILVAIRDGFNIDTTVGKQLDIIGKYTGISRALYSSLSDDDFRTLIKFAVAKHSTNGSLKEIDTVLHNFFSDKIIVFDNYDSTMIIEYDSSLEAIVEIAKTNNIVPKPAGIGLTLTVFTDVVNGIWYTRVTIQNSNLSITYDNPAEIIIGSDASYDSGTESLMITY